RLQLHPTAGGDAATDAREEPQHPFQGRAARTGGREPDHEHLFLGAVMAANAIQIYADKLLRQAKADPKKATILVVLLGVLLFVWFRMAGGGSAAGLARASATVADVRAGGALMPDNLRSSGKANETIAALQEWTRRPIAP